MRNAASSFILIVCIENTRMARTLPQHKSNYASFIDPNYQKVPEVNGWEIAKKFQAFQDSIIATIPDEGTPADAYMYNTHMGAFVRSLDEAKDHSVKASLAFYAKRGSGSPPPAPSSDAAQ
jgi:hypothetical protein